MKSPQKGGNFISVEMARVELACKEVSYKRLRA